MKTNFNFNLPVFPPLSVQSCFDYRRGGGDGDNGDGGGGGGDREGDGDGDGVCVCVCVCVCIKEVGWVRGSGRQRTWTVFVNLLINLTDFLAEILPVLIVHAEFMLGKSPWEKKEVHSRPVM